MPSKKGSGFFGGLLIGALVATIGFSLCVRKLKSNNSNEVKGQLSLKLAHTLDTKHPVHLGMVYMKKRLEEISNGQATLAIYPSGVLGSETKCIEMLQNGVLAMTKTSTSPMEGFVPEMGVFSLPYVFRDREHFWNVLDSKVGKELLLKGEKRNLRGICYFDAGSRNFYTSEKPVLTPKDLANQKIRVMNSKTAIDMVKALGGAPTPIAWGELYSALNQGVVDGAENNPPSYYNNGHHKVCKHFSMDGHTRVPDMLVISTKVWQSYSPEVQGWLQQAANEASLYQRQLWAEKSKEALAAAEKEGAKIYYPDIKPFMEKTKSMVDGLTGTPVGQIYQRIQEVE
jgi:tripartite ATP-independent transporter DctP family solute receptor